MSQKQKETKRLAEFELAMDYWRKISNNPTYQSYNKVIEGFANFDLTKIPLPAISYHYLASIHRSKWPVYVSAFNFLYGFRHTYYEKPENKITIPNVNEFFILYKDQLTKTSSLHSKVWCKELHIDKDICVGMTNVSSNTRSIQYLLPYLSYYKTCKICGETKITYKCPISSETRVMHPDAWIDYLFSKIIKQNRKQLSLKSWNFKHNYTSKDGWNAICNDCIDAGLLPPNWQGRQLHDH